MIYVLLRFTEFLFFIYILDTGLLWRVTEAMVTHCSLYSKHSVNAGSVVSHCTKWLGEKGSYGTPNKQQCHIDVLVYSPPHTSVTTFRASIWKWKDIHFLTVLKPIKSKIKTWEGLCPWWRMSSASNLVSPKEVCMPCAHIAEGNSLMREQPSWPDALPEALHLHTTTVSAPPVGSGGNHWTTM